MDGRKIEGGLISIKDFRCRLPLKAAFTSQDAGKLDAHELTNMRAFVTQSRLGCRAFHQFFSSYYLHLPWLGLRTWQGVPAGSARCQRLMFKTWTLSPISPDFKVPDSTAVLVRRNGFVELRFFLAVQRLIKVVTCLIAE